MTKQLSPLDAFYELMDVYFDNDIVKAKYGITVESAKERYKIIEKSLKALEIIKEKKPDMNMLIDYYFKYSSYIAYVDDFKNPDFLVLGEKLLTEEEFDLLKEVLK